jgi:hypothetical protein
MDDSDFSFNLDSASPEERRRELDEDIEGARKNLAAWADALNRAPTEEDRQVIQKRLDFAHSQLRDLVREQRALGSKASDPIPPLSDKGEASEGKEGGKIDDWLREQFPVGDSPSDMGPAPFEPDEEVPFTADMANHVKPKQLSSGDMPVYHDFEASPPPSRIREELADPLWDGGKWSSSNTGIDLTAGPLPPPVQYPPQPISPPRSPAGTGAPPSGPDMPAQPPGGGAPPNGGGNPPAPGGGPPDDKDEDPFTRVGSGTTGKLLTMSRALSADPTAIMQTVEMVLLEQVEKAKRVGEGVDEAMQSSKFGDFGGSLADSADALQGMFGMDAAGVNPIGGSDMVKVIAGSIRKLDEWGDALTKSQFQLGEFSHSMGQLQGEQEAWQAMFSRQRGEERAEAARRHVESRRRTEEALAPIEDAWDRLKSNLMAWGRDSILNPTIEQFNVGARALGLLRGSDKNEVGNTAWMSDISDDWVNGYGRPGRFNR